MTAVGVLGNGITATAVRDFLSQSKNHHEVALPNAEMVITSPGIPQRDWPKLAVPMISDVEFAVTELRQRGYRGKVVGITGTNGKTTVTSAIAHALNANPVWKHWSAINQSNRCSVNGSALDIRAK